MRFSFAFAFLMLLAPAAFAASAPPSSAPEILRGTNLHWGMSQTQVEQALNAKVTRGEPEMWDEYSIFTAFDGLPAKYVLSFDSSGGLRYLTIIVDRPAADELQGQFDGLKSRLATWYGKPVGSFNPDGASDALYTIWRSAGNELEFVSETSSITNKTLDMISLRKYPQPEDAVTVSARSLAAMPVGGSLKMKWAGTPILVVKRTAEDIKRLLALTPELRSLDASDESSFMKGYSYRMPLSVDELFVHTVYRSRRPDVGVYLNISTEYPCQLTYKDLSGDPAVQGIGMGFYDPCKRHSWDSAGWPQDPGPKVTPLAIPKYHFEPNGDLVIGR